MKRYQKKPRICLETLDFGHHIFNAKSGATAIGAREFLIAYNINLNTRDKRKASELPAIIRESGRPAKDEKRLVL